MHFSCHVVVYFRKQKPPLVFVVLVSTPSQLVSASPGTAVHFVQHNLIGVWGTEAALELFRFLPRQWRPSSKPTGHCVIPYHALHVEPGPSSQHMSSSHMFVSYVCVDTIFPSWQTSYLILSHNCVSLSPHHGGASATVTSGRGPVITQAVASLTTPPCPYPK